MAKKHEYKVWDEKVDSNHPDAAERKVRKQPLDWRDPDHSLVLDGLRVYTRDSQYNQHQGAVEPRWEENDTYLMDSNGQVKVNLGRNPAPIFKQCLLEGRVLYGIIIARDEQSHN
jgi:hypothetical protein